MPGSRSACLFSAAARYDKQRIQIRLALNKPLLTQKPGERAYDLAVEFVQPVGQRIAVEPIKHFFPVSCAPRYQCGAELPRIGTRLRLLISIEQHAWQPGKAM